MLLVSISLGLHWRHSEIRNELRVPLTLAVFTRSHPFLHGVTEEDLVRDPIQERVPCGHHSERERYPGFALSVANEGEKFRSCWTPYRRARARESKAVHCTEYCNMCVTYGFSDSYVQYNNLGVTKAVRLGESHSGLIE